MNGIKGLATALAMLLLSPGLCAAVPRSNVLLIIVDDLGWRDLSCYGSTFHQTLNIDRLAQEGCRFTQAYAAHCRCGGARYGIMAGKSPVRIAGNGVQFSKQDVSVGEAFRDAGYATFYCGKWFLGGGASLPEEQGFTKTFAVGNGNAPQSYFAPYNKARGKHVPAKPPLRGVENAPENEYLSDRLADETIRFIRANKDRPFFAVLSHYAMFAPIDAKENYVARYKKKLQENPAAGGNGWEPEGFGKNKLRQDSPAYAGMLHSVDEGVGRILDLLKEFKVADRTLVVLCSDVGGFSCQGTNSEAFTSNRPLRGGKCHLYEGGIRIPLIVKWPGTTKARGAKIDVPVMTTDLYPTLLEIAGLPAKPEQHLDGRSLAYLLKNPALKQQDPDRCFFWHHAMPRPDIAGDAFSSAVRSGPYKLIDFYDEGRMELYNLSVDAEERHNLIKKLEPKALELKAKLDAWRKQNNTEAQRTKPTKAKG